MHKAIFLDRDGVINREIGNYITCVTDFEVLSHVAINLKRLRENGYLTIIITNQGGIAKELYSHGELESIHQLMQKELAKTGSQVDAIYYCPHHPDFGNCLCRKPGSIMIEKAIARFGINPSQSLMIGDKQRDIDAAHAAGVSAYLIEANSDWTNIVDELLLNISQ